MKKSRLLTPASGTLLRNYSRAPRAVMPMFVTFPELQAAVYGAFPHFRLVKWLDQELHDLWYMGAPSPNPGEMGKRLILPTQYQKWAREVGEKMSAEILKRGE